MMALVCWDTVAAFWLFTGSLQCIWSFSWLITSLHMLVKERWTEKHVILTVDTGNKRMIVSELFLCCQWWKTYYWNAKNLIHHHWTNRAVACPKNPFGDMPVVTMRILHGDKYYWGSSAMHDAAVCNSSHLLLWYTWVLHFPLCLCPEPSPAVQLIPEQPIQTQTLHRVGW